MLKHIKTNKHYEDALARCYELMQLKLEIDSPESNEFEELAELIEKYEKKHYPIPAPKIKARK